MNKKILKKFLIMMMFTGGLFLFSNVSKAAYISITPSRKTASPGQTINISISSDCIGKVSLSASNGTVSTGSIWVEGTVNVTATVGSSGTTIVYAKATDMSDSSGNAVTPSGSTTITISSGTSNNNGSNSSNTGSSSNTNTNTSATKSSVATLSNLGIRPNDFSGFSANKTSYSTEVPNNVESIEIYANKGQGGQTISGTGKKTLKEGTNTFSIVVTAENGKTQKTYTLNVTRKAKDDSTLENTTNETNVENEITSEETEDPAAQAFGLTELTITGIELQPQFKTDVYEYTVDLKENLDKLDIKALATEENANIEITGNENLQEGENIITIIVKGDTEEKSVVYQIIVNKTIQQENEEQLNNKESLTKIIIISIAAGIILIILIVVIVKKIKNKNSTFIPYENLFDNNEEENVQDIEEDNEREKIEELKPKKKGQKGKRFK